MDITCSKCGTEYSLDDTLISKSGTTVRCMNCNQIFKVFRKQDEEPDQWILRQAHGPIRTFDRLPMIQKWITEGKVSENDLISRKNGPWKKIGEIAELKALFKPAPPPPPRGARKKDTDPQKSSRPAKASRVENREPTQRHGFFERPDPQTLKKESEKPTLRPPPPASGRGPDYTTDAPTPLATPKDPNASVYSELRVDPFDEDTAVTVMQPRPTAGRDTVRPALPVTGPAPSAVSFSPTTERAAPAAGGGTPPSPAGPSDAAPKAETSRELKADFSKIPVDKRNEKWNQGADIGVSEPAWTEKAGGMPLYTEGNESLLPPKRKMGRWIAIGVLGAVILTAAVVFIFIPDIDKTLLSEFDNMATAPKADRFKKFFDRGQESFLLDSDAAFLQADREFQKVLALDEKNADALAALAKLYAVWAQYRRDAKLDAMADAAGAADTASQKEVVRLTREFEEKLKEASGWANRALSVNPKSRSAFLAMSDIYRMKGDLTKAAEFLKKATDIQFDVETEYVSVLLDIEKGDPIGNQVSRLADLTANKPMMRGIYRQGRLLASAEEKEKAIAVLDRLLTLNPNHAQGKGLLSRVKDEKPIWILESDAHAAKETAAEKHEPKESLSSGQKKEPVSETKEADEGRHADEKLSKGSIPTLLARAKRLQKRGKSGDAKSLYEQVLEESPSNLDALSGVGYYYLDKGASGQAIASFRRCLTVSPNFGPALIGLAETYKSMGQNSQALKYYRRYLEANPNGSQAGIAKYNLSKLGSGPSSEPAEPAEPEKASPPESELETPPTPPTPPTPTESTRKSTPLLGDVEDEKRDDEDKKEEKKIEDKEETEKQPETSPEEKKPEVIIIERDKERDNPDPPSSE